MVCIGGSQIPNFYVEDTQPIAETQLILKVPVEERPVSSLVAKVALEVA
jgi:hypothetical protein